MQKILTALLLILTVGCSSPTSPASPTLTPAPVFVATLKMTATPERIERGGTSTIIIDVIGSNGQPFAGARLELRTFAGTLSTDTATTDQHGRASVEWSGDVDGTVLASIGTITGQVNIGINVPLPTSNPPAPGPTFPIPPTVPSCGEAGDVRLLQTQNGNTVRFVLEAFLEVQGGAVVTLLWNFGDGSPVRRQTDNSAAHVTTHTYTTPGTFTPSAVVSCDGGAGLSVSGAPVVIVEP